MREMSDGCFQSVTCTIARHAAPDSVLSFHFDAPPAQGPQLTPASSPLNPAAAFSTCRQDYALLVPFQLIRPNTRCPNFAAPSSLPRKKLVSKSWNGIRMTCRAKPLVDSKCPGIPFIGWRNKSREAGFLIMGSSLEPYASKGGREAPDA